jgi:hypothetical protein
MKESKQKTPATQRFSKLDELPIAYKQKRHLEMVSLLVIILDDNVTGDKQM